MSGARRPAQAARPRGASRRGAPAQAAAAQPCRAGRSSAAMGIVVNYPARGARRLPAVPASAYVIADAGTGAVLAAKDPHGLVPAGEHAQGPDRRQR